MNLLGIIISPLVAVAFIPNSKTSLPFNLPHSALGQIACKPISSTVLGSPSSQLCLAAVDPRQVDFDPEKLPEGWLAIASSRQVGAQPVSINCFGKDILFWRGSDGQLNGFEDRCPHRSVKLSLGEIVQNPDTKEPCIQCPYHGLEFDQKGQCTLDPKDQESKPFLKIGKVSVLEKDDVIWIQLGKGGGLELDSLNGENRDRQVAPDSNSSPRMKVPAGWWAISISQEIGTQPVHLKRFGMDLVLSRGPDGLVVEDRSLQGGKISSFEKNGVIWIQWGKGEFPKPDSFSELNSFHFCLLKLRSKANFGLNVEGQLDNDHVPFVHRNSFWPIAKSVMENRAPVQNFTANGVRWHYEDPGFYWDMVYPNILLNPRFQDYSMTIIYAPVDSETTDLYIRSHRTFLVDPPLVRVVVDLAYLVVYYFIALEDQRMATSQQVNIAQYGQKFSEFFCKDKLFRDDDRGIWHFRSWLKGMPPFFNALSDAPNYETDPENEVLVENPSVQEPPIE